MEVTKIIHKVPFIGDEIAFVHSFDGRAVREKIEGIELCWKGAQPLVVYLKYTTEHSNTVILCNESEREFIKAIEGDFVSFATLTEQGGEENDSERAS